MTSYFLKTPPWGKNSKLDCYNHFSANVRSTNDVYQIFRKRACKRLRGAHNKTARKESFRQETSSTLVIRA